MTTLRDAPAAMQWMNPQEKLIQLASPFINYLFPLDMFTAALLYGGVALGIAFRWPGTCATRRNGGCSPCGPVPIASVQFDECRFRRYSLCHHVRFSTVCRNRANVADAADALDLRCRIDRAVRRADGDGGGCLVSPSTRPCGTPFDYSQRSGRSLGLRDQCFAGRGARLLGRGPTQPPHFELVACRLPSARFVTHRAESILASLVRQSGTTAHQPSTKIRSTCPRGTGHSTTRCAGGYPDVGTAALDEFDFVLMLEAGADPNPDGFVPRCLTLLSRTDFAALYRVRHKIGACGAAGA